MSIHVPVLLEESMLLLKPRDGGVYVDGTLGGGSHTRTLLERSQPTGRVTSFDVDRSALVRARTTFAEFGDRWRGIEQNFRYMDQELPHASVDGILLDLGFSSDELENPDLGLSFQSDGPLDMRLGMRANDDGLTAEHIVNNWSEQELFRMLDVFGEERYAKRIAAAIVALRASHPLTRTSELVDLLRASVPVSAQHGGIHPATRTFQALRIAVNDELQALKQAIVAAHALLRPGGTLAIITFHSLEDRIVKQAFTQDEWEREQKKPIIPTPEEVARNPRARSAKLRSAIKL